jgi:hypothetical protein
VTGGDAARMVSLVERLRAWPADPAAKRAVDLVLSTELLGDPEFVTRCVVELADDPPIAVIDWSELGALVDEHAERGDVVPACQLRAIHTEALSGPPAAPAS